MKIAYIVSNHLLNRRANTGYARHISETIAGLEKKGHSVIFIDSFEQDNATSEFPITVRKGRYKFKKFIPSFFWESLKDAMVLRNNSRFIERVRQIIEEENPDLVYERTSYLTNTIKAKSVNTNLPWILEVNAPFVDQRKAISGSSAFLSFAKRMERSKYEKCSSILCVSGALKDHLTQEYSIDQSRILINHNGVSPEYFTRNSASNESLVFGFVGSIMNYHGIDELIIAFSKVLAKIESVKLLIVGDGESLPILKELAKNLGCDGKVTFTGSVASNEVAKKIDAMSICIMPKSNWYGSPVKIFEYGVMKKPIIAPKVKPVLEVMTHRVDGLIVDGIDELASAMIELSNNPKLGIDLAQSFYEKVVKDYTWDANVERIDAEIKQLMVSF